MTLRFSLTPNARVVPPNTLKPKKKAPKKKLPVHSDPKEFSEKDPIIPPKIDFVFNGMKKENNGNDDMYDYSDFEYSDDDIDKEQQEEIEDEIEDLKCLNHFELKEMYEKELRIYYSNIDKVSNIINKKLTQI